MGSTVKAKNKKKQNHYIHIEHNIQKSQLSHRGFVAAYNRHKLQEPKKNCSTLKKSTTNAPTSYHHQKLLDPTKSKNQTQHGQALQQSQKTCDSTHSFFDPNVPRIKNPVKLQFGMYPRCNPIPKPSPHKSMNKEANSRIKYLYQY